jgi:hypothetical protein
MQSKFIPFPLNGHWGKKLGIYVVMLAVLTTAFFLIFQLENDWGYQREGIIRTGLYAVCLGMYFMAFSKEKVEDERVAIIRARSMQATLGLIITPMITIGLIGSIMSFDSMQDEPLLDWGPVLLMGLLFYNLYFNYNIRNDDEFNFGEQGTIVENLNTNVGKATTIILIIILLSLTGLSYLIF